MRHEIAIGMNQKGLLCDRKGRRAHVHPSRQEALLMRLSVDSLRRVVKRDLAICWCSMKMSPPNCSVKMSSPYGDFHDEQEGSATCWARQGSPGGQDHEPGGRPGVAPYRATVQATEGPLPSAGPARLGASPPGPTVAAAVTCRPPRPGRHAHDDDLRGLQRRPPHREAAAGPRPASEPGDRAPYSPGARPAASAPPPRAPPPEPAPAGPRDAPARAR